MWRSVTTVTWWTGTGARAVARWRRDGRVSGAGARRGRAVRCAGTGLWLRGQRSVTTATGGHTTDAAGLARWSADGSAAGGAARGSAGTGCAGATKGAMTGTPSQGTDAALSAVWSRGMHAAGRGGTGSAGDLATAARQDAGRGKGRRGHPRSATTGTLWAGTDAAHHARSSAGGSARGETQTARTGALHQDAGTRRWEGRRSATTGIQRTETGAHHRA